MFCVCINIVNDNKCCSSCGATENHTWSWASSIGMLTRSPCHQFQKVHGMEGRERRCLKFLWAYRTSFFSVILASCWPTYAMGNWSLALNGWGSSCLWWWQNWGTTPSIGTKMASRGLCGCVWSLPAVLAILCGVEHSFKRFWSCGKGDVYT